MSEATNYHFYDHSHCWERERPPCGQKIEHLKCCICEKLNPKARGVAENYPMTS